MSQPRVAIFGDAMTDLYWHGHVVKLSAEAPIPVVRIERTESLPGGAGNVVANCEALGLAVIDCTTPGPVKHRLMANNVQIARWDFQDRCPSWEGAMPEADGYIISDYGKGAVPQNVNWPRPLFVDTKKPPHCYPEDAIFFPNEHEFEQFEDEYRSLPWVVKKCGAKGIKLFNKGECILQYPSFARFVCSVNGAGDTVLAAFVSEYLSYTFYCAPTVTPSYEGAMIQALKFANYAAAIAVGKPLTSTVTQDEISRRINDEL